MPRRIERPCFAFLCIAAAVVSGAGESRAVTSCLSEEIGVRLGDAPFLCGLASGRATSPDGTGTPTTSHGTSLLGVSGGGVDITVVAPGGIGAETRGDAAFGLLTAFSAGMAGAYTDPTPVPTAESYAQTEVAFGDRVTVTSSTLALGTPVALTAIVSVEGAFGISCCGGLFSFYAGNVGSAVTRSLVLLNNAVPAYYEEFALNSTVGGEIFLRLGIRAGSGATDGPVPTVGFADMSSSGEMFLRPETPGVAFVAASGHSYTVVPEPDEGVQALGAALGLIGVARISQRA